MQYLFSIIYLLNIIIKANLQKLQEQYLTVDSKCFHQESLDCPQIESPNNCPCKSIKLSLNEISQRISIYCCNLNSETLNSSLECANFSENITDLHIRNATFETLNISKEKWKHLKSLSITDGQINHIEGQFVNTTTISCLNLSNNAILEFENNSIAQMNYLENLDLSHNSCSNLPTLSNNLTILDISGINNISCLDIKQAINRIDSDAHRLTFRNKKTTVCSAAASWTWLEDSEKLPIEQLLPDISECPKGKNWSCECTFDYVLKVTRDYPTFKIFNVDCSNNNLTKLPENLPPYTINLVVNNNKIIKLDELVTNPSYQYLKNLYADYNEISSITILEGSRFVNNFDTLSLRYNKLKSISTNVLVPSALKASNEVSGRIYLGGNKILCDCRAARYLKNWFEVNIVDGDEIYCSNSIDRVKDLEVIKMCKFDDDFIDYIYCIIAIEIILLFTILTKLLIDYLYYKKNRKLPWLSRVMPKTRFDRLFELYL